MSPKFSVSLRGNPRKSNNAVAALPAKVEIRQRVLDAVGPQNASVMDAFAGEGQLHKLVWSQARNYTGCDRIWYRDTRLMYVADNRRLMRAIDLTAYNIFDFDSWGSPWELMIILGARRTVRSGERIGITLTEGTSLKVRLGTVPFGLAHLAGFDPKTRGISRSTDLLVDRAIRETARRLNCRLVHRWQALGKTGAQVVYIGLVLEGVA